MTFKRGHCLLKKRLLEARKTQEWLASTVGKTEQQISDYANNRKYMGYETAKNIAEAIGCGMEELYEWKYVSSSK